MASDTIAYIAFRFAQINEGMEEKQMVIHVVSLRILDRVLKHSLDIEYEQKDIIILVNLFE